MKKGLTSGTAAPVSAQYEIVNRAGNRTGIERTVVKGEPLPPTLAKGQSYRIADRTKH
jgi:methyl coenzyme M reductase subunit D